MKNSRLSLILMLLFLCALLWKVGSVPAQEEVDPAQYPPGLLQAEVRRRLGAPRHVARQILYRRYLEQWVYEGPKGLRIEFDCPRGQPARVHAVYPIMPGNP